MNTKQLFFLIITYFGCVANVSAGLIIDIYESGSNVEASYSGTIDLSATQGFIGTFTGFDGYLATGGNVSFTNGTTDYYGVDFSSWTAFGTSGFGAWDTSSGDALALFTNPVLGLATGYVTNTLIQGIATEFNTTLATLGFNTGSYVSTLTNGSFTDTVTVNIGTITPSIPEPSMLALMGLGIIGMFGVNRRRRSQL